jgi:hypothetical protein
MKVIRPDNSVGGEQYLALAWISDYNYTKMADVFAASISARS